MDEAKIDRPFDVDDDTLNNGSQDNRDGNDDPKADPPDPADPAEPAPSITDTGEFDIVEEDDPADATNRLEEKLQETNERLLRVAADFENYRKRIEREKGEYLKYANERLLRDLLTVVDNLYRALTSSEASGDSQAIVDGIRLVYQDILKVLDKFGVKPMVTTQKVFDPMYHEALQTAETEEAEPGTILQEVQRGYMMHDRVLRAAMVVVAASPEETSPGVDLQVEDLKKLDPSSNG